MAVLLHFPVRPAAAAPIRVEGLTAEVVILPCIRREPMGTIPRARNEVPEQRQA